MSVNLQTRSRGQRMLRALQRRQRSLHGLATRAGFAALPRLGFDASRMGAGVVLVARRGADAGRGWMMREKEIFDYVAGAQIGALLRMYRVDCVLDVGAHEGQYAERLRAAGYRGQIVSFEPTPNAFEFLCRAAADDPRWAVHQLALGREDGELAMNVVPGTLSSLRPATTFGAGRYPQLQESEAVTVRVRRLDALLDELVGDVAGARLYLKLDTQGYDLDVFEGLGDRAQDFVGMQSELALLRVYEGSPRMCEALAVYESAGFEIAGLYPITRQSRTGRVVEYDCVLVRPSALRKVAAKSS